MPILIHLTDSQSRIIVIFKHVFPSFQLSKIKKNKKNMYVSANNETGRVDHSWLVYLVCPALHVVDLSPPVLPDKKFLKSIILYCCIYFWANVSFEIVWPIENVITFLWARRYFIIEPGKSEKKTLRKTFICQRRFLRLAIVTSCEKQRGWC